MVPVPSAGGVCVYTNRTLPLSSCRPAGKAHLSRSGRKPGFYVFSRAMVNELVNDWSKNMDQQRPKDEGQPLRRLRVERREAQARGNGWSGPWPPEKACIESAADCEHYLTRLESGEHRAGFLGAVGNGLVAFFQNLQPEHFRRFAAVLFNIAQDPTASHRTRLRAVQAAIRPLHRAMRVLPRLKDAGDQSLQTHLQTLLAAFCQELSADDFAALGTIMIELTGPAAKTASDKVRACTAALTLVTEALEMLVDLRSVARTLPPPGPDPNDPEVQRRREAIERELDEMEARILAEIEEERRTGKPVRHDWRGERIDGPN